MLFVIKRINSFNSSSPFIDPPRPATILQNETNFGCMQIFGTIFYTKSFSSLSPYYCFLQYQKIYIFIKRGCIVWFSVNIVCKCSIGTRRYYSTYTHLTNRTFLTFKIIGSKSIRRGKTRDKNYSWTPRYCNFFTIRYSSTNYNEFPILDLHHWN